MKTKKPKKRTKHWKDDKYWADYADIGQFSVDRSKWKDYTDEEFYEMGKKIVKDDFDGDVDRDKGIDKAYDTIVRKFKKGGWIDFKSKRAINKIKKDLENKGETYSIKYDTDGSRFGLKGGGRYRITTGEYLSTTYAKGGETDSDGGSVSSLNTVEVIFKNPKHNYTTNVSHLTTEEDARKYFIGIPVNVASYPKEKFVEVIDIKYSVGSEFEKGGSISKSNVRVNNSPLLRYANFKDGSHINLIQLKPYKSGGQRYKSEYKFAVSIGTKDKGQQVLNYRTLKEAERDFEELVGTRGAKTPLINMQWDGYVNEPFEKGGKTKHWKDDKYWADYSDIGIYSMDRNRSNELSDEEFYKIGKDIVDTKFKGDIGNAWDSIVKGKHIHKFRKGRNFEKGGATREGGHYVYKGKYIMSRKGYGVGATTTWNIWNDRGAIDEYALDFNTKKEAMEYIDENVKDYAKGGKVEKKGNEMLIGGIAGVLLGVFLNR